MNKEKYIEIITAKLNESICREDENLLNNWLQKDANNQELFDDMKRVWNDTKSYKSNFEPNLESAWNKIQSKISEEKTVTKSVSINRFKMMKIASALLILLAMGFLIKSYFNNEFIIETTAINETKQITLPDGSVVSINENSSLSYAKDFSKRKVVLNGEAFFDVATDENKPFSVQTNYTETFVLGTTFNINSKLENSVEVSLFTGKIKFIAEDNSVILSPGEKLKYNNLDHSIEKETKEIVNDISWKTDQLVFENTKIAEVVLAINDYFGTAVFVSSNDASCGFTGTFYKPKIENVIQSLTYSLNTDYRIENGNFYIDSLNCK